MKSQISMNLVLIWILVLPISLFSQYNATSQIDSSLYKLKATMSNEQSNGSPIEIAKNYVRLGSLYQKYRVYNEAIEKYNKALDLISPQDTLTVVIKNEIGKIYLSLKNSTKAKEYFNESMRIAAQTKYTKGEALSKGLLGGCYEKEGKYLKALEYQRESLQLFKEINDHQGISIVHENIGSIYEDLEQYKLAYEYFKKANLFFKDDKHINKISVLNNLGDVKRKTGKYEDALFYTSKALDLANKYKDKYQLKSAHKDLSKTYDLLGDHKKAFEHLLISEHVDEEIIASQNTNQLHTLQMIYETKQKEAQIARLLQQEKISKANQDVLLVSLISTIFLVIIVFFYFKRKRKANSRIQEYKQRTLKAELDKKAIEEKNLQRAIHLKTAALSRYSLHIAQKNKMLLDLSLTLTNIADRKNVDSQTTLKKLAKQINFDLKQEREWDEFNNIFKEIHPEFLKKLSSLSKESLSPAELRLGMLLRLNLSSKEIASILRVTPDSVRVARYRLRKKLPIGQKEELVNFMITL